MPLDSKEMTARTHLSSRNHNEHFHFIFLKEMCPYFHSFLLVWNYSVGLVLRGYLATAYMVWIPSWFTAYCQPT